MAFDAFLKLDGIDGDSFDEDYARWIVIESFSWGVTQASNRATGGGGGTGKAVFQDFHFVINFSKASPELFNRCATGEHIKTGVLAVRQEGLKVPVELYNVRMTDLLVSSFQDANSSGGDRALNQVSLNFTNLALEYMPPRGA